LKTINFSGYLDFIVIIVCLVWGCKTYRDEEKGGIIRYGQSVGYGTLSGFFSSMIYGVYFFVFISYIDPEFLDRLLLLMEENLYTQGLSDEQIEFSLDIYESMRSPVLWSISSLMTITFLGFIASLIISIFIRKEGDPFDKTMSQINSDYKQS